ncbi:Na(+)/H(+) antiporter subunit C [Arcanobacterium bovis]|nr:Na(+)/H(+) antiporter subunit C [Arcanobacterium bovis]
MNVSFALLMLGAVLIGVGVYLILERSLARVVLGFANLTNGINILFLVAGGKAGAPPIVGQAQAEEMADPLVQAMMLTAIVIGVSTIGFLLAMAYRSWQLDGNDEVQDDMEDRRIARKNAKDRLAARADVPLPLEEDAPASHDETEDALGVSDDHGERWGGHR